MVLKQSQRRDRDREDIDIGPGWTPTPSYGRHYHRDGLTAVIRPIVQILEHSLYSRVHRRTPSGMFFILNSPKMFAAVCTFIFLFVTYETAK